MKIGMNLSRKTWKVLWIRLFAFILLLMLLQGCGKTDQDYDIAGRTYLYTGESFVGLVKDPNDPFYISIEEDGTFSYYESMFSSYLGTGEWSIKDGILTLADNEEYGYPFVNLFRIEGDDLIFIEEGSSNFLYIKVKDGERFTSDERNE